MNLPLHNPSCFRAHMGTWLLEPGYASQALAAIRSGLWKPEHAPRHAMQAAGEPVFDPQSNPENPDLAYTNCDGVAVIELTGVMAKAQGKYASVGTVAVRRYLRMAAEDKDCSAILMVIDSPGGTCAGTQQLGEEVASIDENDKPVFAHIEDCGASAAYWVASQARRVTASMGSLVGSLGTYSVVEDTSEQAKAEGVRVHVLSTGPQKGAFVDGAPVTPEQLTEAMSVVNSLNALFMNAVGNGRDMDAGTVAALFDGRVHMAAKAKDLNLIDDVAPLSQVLSTINSYPSTGISVMKLTAEAITNLMEQHPSHAALIASSARAGLEEKEVLSAIAKVEALQTQNAIADITAKFSSLAAETEKIKAAHAAELASTKAELADAKKRLTHVGKLESDAPRSVGGDPSQGLDGLTGEARWRAEFASSPELQKRHTMGGVEGYVALMRVEARKKAKTSE